MTQAIVERRAVVIGGGDGLEHIAREINDRSAEESVRPDVAVESLAGIAGCRGARGT